MVGKLVNRNRATATPARAENTEGKVVAGPSLAPGENKGVRAVRGRQKVPHAERGADRAERKVVPIRVGEGVVAINSGDFCRTWSAAFLF